MTKDFINSLFSSKRSSKLKSNSKISGILLAGTFFTSLFLSLKKKWKNKKIEVSKQDFAYLLNKNIPSDMKLRDLSDKAQVDYSYLNKIVNKKIPDDLQISKDVVIKLCLSLKLGLITSKKMLFKAGYSLSNSIKRDLVLRNCISKKLSVIDTNLELDKHKLKPLKI